MEPAAAHHAAWAADSATSAERLASSSGVMASSCPRPPANSATLHERRTGESISLNGSPAIRRDKPTRGICRPLGLSGQNAESG